MNAGRPGEPSEQELRAQLEEELRKITVDDVVLQTVVTLVNLGGQRLGISEGTRDARDLGQVRVAIEAVRALLPLLEADADAARRVQPVRDALAHLQVAYAREVEGEGEGGTAGEREEARPQAPPAREQQPTRDEPQRRSSGRLWVPPGSKT
jgi:hypothetical protein